MKPVPVVKYTEFYVCPLPDDPFVFLHGYPTDPLILLLSKINGIFFNEGYRKFESQQQIFRNCFPLLDDSKKLKVVDFIRKAYDGDIAFFTGACVLRLINLCLMHPVPMPEEEQQLNIQKVQNDIFDSILIQNDLYYVNASNEDLNTYKAIWRLQLMQQQYVRDYAQFLTIAPIKNFLFHKFITKHFPQGPQYIKEFSDGLGIPGFFNYFIFFMEIVQTVFESYKDTQDAKHILNLESGILKVIENFSLKFKDIIDGKYRGNIHGDLIPRPFYYVFDEHPVILDLHFFVHIVDIALPYNFYRYSSLNGSQQFPKFTLFKAMLGKKYYEEFIAGEVLKKIFRARSYSLFSSPDSSSLPDFTVLRHQKDIVMIEVKSSDVHYNVLENMDVDEFTTFLDDKFCNQKLDAGTKNKGVYQVVQQIADFANTQKLDGLIRTPSQKNKVTIYPVLIYTDNAMDMAGVNAYLNEKFQVAVKPYRRFFKNVFPLTTINLSIFLRYYARLRTEPSLLFDLIRTYWKEAAINEREYQRYPHPMAFFDKNTSFDQFIDMKFKGEDQSKNLRAIMEDLELNV